jgi:hypothetical protein
MTKKKSEGKMRGVFFPFGRLRVRMTGIRGDDSNGMTSQRGTDNGAGGAEEEAGVMLVGWLKRMFQGPGGDFWFHQGDVPI